MSDPSLIRSAQQTLNQKGFNAGTADGIMGPHTEAALKKFQSANSLQATGQLDSSTVAALGISPTREATRSNATSSGASTSNMNTASARRGGTGQ